MAFLPHAPCYDTYDTKESIQQHHSYNIILYGKRSHQMHYYMLKDCIYHSCNIILYEKRSSQMRHMIPDMACYTAVR